MKDVQEIIGHHLIVWWFIDMALLWTEDVVGAVISVAVIFLLVFSFIPLFLFMVQWIVAIPLDLYFLASGEESTVPSASYRGRWTPPSAKDLGLWIIKASLFGVGLLVGVYFLGHTVESSSLEMVDELLRLGRNDQLLKNLLLLSAQSAAFGAVEAYLFPKHKKLGLLVLLLVATLGAVVFWELLLWGWNSGGFGVCETRWFYK
ncbi:MAG: hypothetical protein PWQ79_1670 [Thermococcaceae archaeon]|nr:hypothetical protein [Thermococcaceae archaeon]MDK2914755.1 hypothetical protein [Thermococcaceae archaeon]